MSLEPRPRFLPRQRTDDYGSNFDPSHSDALVATLLALGDVLLAKDPTEGAKLARLIIVNHLALLGFDYALNSWMESE